MTETTFLVTAFVDAEFELYRVVKLLDGKPADDYKYAKNSDELLSIFKG